MTAQQAYEHIREYFSRPDAQFGIAYREDELSEERRPACVYLADDGRKCAVGCLIPDEILHEWKDQLNVLGSIHALEAGGFLKPDEGEEFFIPFKEIPGLKDLLNGDDADGQTKYRFLVKAQAAHDDVAMRDGRMEHFIRRLDGAASACGLAVTP